MQFGTLRVGVKVEDLDLRIWGSWVGAQGAGSVFDLGDS